MYHHMAVPTKAGAILNVTKEVDEEQEKQWSERPQSDTVPGRQGYVVKRDQVLNNYFKHTGNKIYDSF